jgi:hypothetical protein
MIEHFAIQFGGAYSNLLSLIAEAHRLDRENHVKPVQEQVLSKDRLRFLAGNFFSPIVGELGRMRIDALLPKGLRLQAQIVSDINTWTADRLLDAVKEFRRDLDIELNKHKFALLLSPNDQYFEQEKLFGVTVYDKLGSARQDIKDAGNCFAGELYSASVFHLMRVAEHGLRIVARRLRVTVKDNGTRIPIQYADWNKVITAIDNKIKEARKITAGAKKEARLNYYSDALERCSAMKDLFRNPVSHTRTKYTYGGTLDVMERVRNFMQFLARPVPR